MARAPAKNAITVNTAKARLDRSTQAEGLVRQQIANGQRVGLGYYLALIADASTHVGTTLEVERTARELAEVATWFSSWEELFRGAGAVGPRPVTEEDAVRFGWTGPSAAARSV